MTRNLRDFSEVLFSRASRRPDDIAYRFHSAGMPTTVDLQMSQLALRVKAVAGGLQKRNLNGERVVLALPHGPEFIVALFACMAAGAIAVPVPQQRVGKDDSRFRAIILDAKPALVLVDAGDLAKLTTVNVSTLFDLRADSFASLADVADDPDCFQQQERDSKALALLQYTSGSTGDPKGVMITHGNFLSNCQAIQETLRIDENSAGVLWLPFYHDMGLVGAVLLPMYCDGCVDLMSPPDFLRSPMSWLNKLAQVKATMTAAPNFALERCCDTATPDSIANLDLSSLRCLLTGSEPVNPNTLERFAATFAPCGFKPDAYVPAYGLAEATLLATGTLKHGIGPTTRSLDARALATGSIQTASTDKAAVRFVGNGAPNDLIRIVNAETGHPLDDGKIGEIWLTGPGMAQGYWNRPELTAKAFGARLNGAPEEGPFYKTGDLGFILENDLYITGRLKDLIIVRGRNIYPQDIEEVATRQQELLLTGGAAAFAVNRGQGEEIVLVVEANLDSVRALRAEKDASDLVADLLRRLSASHEIVPAEVCIIRPGRLPRTSSGKIRRSAAREEWEATAFASTMIHRWVRPQTKPAPQTQNIRVEGRQLNRRDVENWLLGRLAQHSGRPKHLIDLDEPFASYGLDSITAVEMIDAVNNLNTAGRTVEATDLFNYPTIARLLDHMFAKQESIRPVSASVNVATGTSKADIEREAAALAALLTD